MPLASGPTFRTFAEHALKLRPEGRPAGGVRAQSGAEQAARSHRGRRKPRLAACVSSCLKARQLRRFDLRCGAAVSSHDQSPGTALQSSSATRRRASSNLFQIVKPLSRSTCPTGIRPSVGTSNAEELIFDRLDSGYIVSVATSEGAGRSATAQLLHASEAAFWSDLPLQMASLMQTVPSLDDTEIIIESHCERIQRLPQSVEKGGSRRAVSSYAIFLPWSSDPGYREDIARTVFDMDSEERKLAELYELDEEAD